MKFWEDHLDLLIRSRTTLIWIRSGEEERVEVLLEDGQIGRASVPSGASTGKHEAVELRDHEKSRYGGKGVQKAIHSIDNEINLSIKGIKVFEQEEIDRTLIALDGTENKSRLGANAILGTSIAVAKAAAKTKLMPLYQYLSVGLDKFKLPMPMMTILNGEVVFNK